VTQVTPHRGEGWTALADPTRRAIFEAVAERPQAVGEIADKLPVSRPAVSQHLKVLKDAGLVVGRRAGNRCIYEVDMHGIEALRSYLDRFWNRALTTYKFAVEQVEEPE
jgi:DNA-binding transcriptional ArsR family regulator